MKKHKKIDTVEKEIMQELINAAQQNPAVKEARRLAGMRNSRGKVAMHKSAISQGINNLHTLALINLALDRAGL